MAPSFHFLMSDDLQILVYSLWLDVRSLAILDVAFSSRKLRPSWLTILKRLRSDAIDNWSHSLLSLMWLSKRGIRASQMNIDYSPVRGCDILRVDTSDIEHLGLRGSYNITDQCIVDVVCCCLKLRSINLRGYGQVTDAGVTALGTGCGQLQSIDLSSCYQVTDAGIMALAAGCGQLQSINLESCNQVTDAGVTTLGAGCGKLQIIDLRACREVTDAGIMALAAGCGQLQNIDLRGSGRVTDAGVATLGAGCGQLQCINLHSCNQVTDAGAELPFWVNTPFTLKGTEALIAPVSAVNTVTFEYVTSNAPPRDTVEFI